MSSRPQEHSVLIALRELDRLELQRREREAAEASARLEVQARAEAEHQARERAAAELRLQTADAARARIAAHQAHQAHALRQRNAEIEAAVRAEQALRIAQVQAELDAQLQLRARRERGGQRWLAAGILATLGLVGALGAMFLTQPPRLAVVAGQDGGAQDVSVPSWRALAISARLLTVKSSSKRRPGARCCPTAADVGAARPAAPWRGPALANVKHCDSRSRRRHRSPAQAPGPRRPR